jgi:hypothetical protein
MLGTLGCIRVAGTRTCGQEPEIEPFKQNDPSSLRKQGPITTDANHSEDQ